MIIQEASLGCLMLFLGAAASDRMLKWAKENIPESETTTGDGYEMEPHTTVLYGFHDDVTAAEIENAIGDFGPVEIELGPITRFENDEQDVLKIDIESERLHELNGLLREQFEGRFTNDYPDYKPHLTLAYVKHGALPELTDSPEFYGDKYGFDLAVYSTAESKQRVLVSLSSELGAKLNGTSS